MQGKFINKTGEIHTTNQGFEFVIIEYKNSKNSTIEFSNNVIMYNIRYDHIKDKSISNPYYKSVYGIGFLGEGENITRLNNTKSYIYAVWLDMLRRCYSDKHQVNHPTYKNCSVDESWHNFQNFAKWMKQKHNPNSIFKWELDKDILSKGNKVYSPETCAFVPQEINGIFIKTNIIRGDYPIGVSLTNSLKFQAKVFKNKKQVYLGLFNTPEEAFQAYKNAKEAHIKEVADKWKDQIDGKVYQAMYKYKVEITD